MIKIASDFTTTPGPRWRKQGKFSGEEFRETILEPAYRLSQEKREKLSVDFDGTYGYFDSFLEESFGGLARIYNDNTIAKNFDFISLENETIIPKVLKYIEHALEKK